MLNINKVIFYDDLVNFVVDYIYINIVKSTSYSLPSFSKTISGTFRFTGSNGKSSYNYVNAHAGYFDYSLTLNLKTNTKFNKKHVDTKAAIKEKLKNFLINHGLLNNDSSTIIQYNKVINFGYMMNFFNAVAKFISSYYLSYYIDSKNKIYLCDSTTIDHDGDRQTASAQISDIFKNILTIDKDWILEAEVTSSMASCSSCSSSSSSSSSCSSSSSSSFIVYLNLN